MARPANKYSYKQNAVSISWNNSFYTNTDFFDFWGLDSPESLSFVPNELAYEWKLGKNFFPEIAIGYTELDESSVSRLDTDDEVAFDANNFYLLASVKKYWTITGPFRFFAGVGAGVYYIDGSLTYASSESHSKDFSRTLVGGHLSAGTEYFISTGGDYPVSIGLEYRYTYMQTDTVDKELIDYINTETDSSYISEDLDLGGHSISLVFKLLF
jgi:opacity protein-like surface antigen